MSAGEQSNYNVLVQKNYLDKLIPYAVSTHLQQAHDYIEVRASYQMIFSLHVVRVGF